MRNACLDIALLCDGERSRSKLVLYLNSVFLFLEITTVDIIQLIHTVAFHACMGNHLLTTYIRLLLYFKLVKNGFDLDIQIINNSLWHTVLKYSDSTTVLTNQKTFQKSDQTVGRVVIYLWDKITGYSAKNIWHVERDTHPLTYDIPGYLCNRTSQSGNIGGQLIC